MRIAERHHHAAVEQRRRSGALGEAEILAGRPAAMRHLLFDHGVGRPQLRPRLLDAERIPFCPQAAAGRP